MEHLLTQHDQFKKRFIGVGFYHWYNHLTNHLAMLPKVTIAHDPDAPARGRVLSNTWRKLRKPRPSWIVYLE